MFQARISEKQLNVLHGFVQFCDCDLFRNYYAHARTLPRLTRFALGSIGKNLGFVVKDIPPLSTLPAQGSSVLNLSKVVDRDSKILGDLLRGHFIFYHGATSWRSAGLLLIERATLAIDSPTISSEDFASPFLSV